MFRYTASRLIVRTFSSWVKPGLEPGRYVVRSLAGEPENELGRILGKVFGTRTPKWNNSGTLTVTKPEGQVQKLDGQLTPSSEDPATGIKGDFQVTAYLKQKEDKLDLTGVKMVTGKANILGFEVQLDGQEIEIEVPVKVQPNEGKPGYEITGQLSPSCLLSVSIFKDAPKSVLAVLKKLPTINMSMQLEADASNSDTEENNNKLAPK